MVNVHIEFEKIDGVIFNEIRKGKIRPGYEYVNVHMVFDIKMYGKFTRKEIFVTNGHRIAPPSSSIYSSFVSRDIIRIDFLLESLKDLEIFACNIGNEYLKTKCSEKLWTEAGTEFGTEKGMVK